LGPAEHADIVRNGRVDLFVRGLREHRLHLVGTEARVDDLQPGEWRVESVGARRMVPGPSITIEVRAGEVTRIDYDIGRLATLKQ
jgi:hypothetical protein